MKKLVFVALVLAQSNPAFALKVGDFAEFLGSLNGARYDRKIKVVEITNNNNIVTVEEWVKVADEIQTKILNYDTTNDDRYVRIANDAEFCALVGTTNQGTGVIEMFSVLGALIPTCHLTLPNPTHHATHLWMGDVPMGTVRMIKGQFEMALVSYLKQ